MPHREPSSPWLELPRAEWAALRSATPLTLSEQDLERVRGINERLNLDEVVEVYLPLSRLLNLYVAATQDLHRATDTFIGTLPAKVPYVIGIAGSVAVGKSTTARILQALLSRWPNHPEVALVTTDGFLLPNQELERRGLMERKGFPESYDTAELLRMVTAVKSGATDVTVPVYSHLTYDIVDGVTQRIKAPDILILEGLNVLQTGTAEERRVFVSDLFDLSIYVDAEEQDIARWYVERFRRLRDTAFKDDRSYFRRYSGLSDEEADATARDIWERINAVNLRENIAPTRPRADLILRKGPQHAVETVSLRRL